MSIKKYTSTNALAALLNIFVFALLYHSADALDANKIKQYIDNNDFVYLHFSLTTFSTLGYGDLTITADKHIAYTLLSSLQSIIGNLHLGAYVASVFYLISEKRSSI